MDDQKRSRPRSLWQRISSAFVQDIPPELHACESCRKTSCLHGDWTVCENRITQMRRLVEIDAKKSD